MAGAALKLVEDKGMDKSKALETALGQIERNFGKGSIMRLGEQRAMDIEALSTGSLSLDIALGIGGLPRGRIIEIYGPESSGKTTLALHAIAEAQKLGGTCAFIDAEHALDPTYAAKLGVNVEDLLVSQPDTGEQALEIADMLVRSNSVDMVVIDSVAALTPRAEIEGEMGEMQVGLQARDLLREDAAQPRRFSEPVHIDQRGHQHGLVGIQRCGLQQRIGGAFIDLNQIGTSAPASAVTVVVGADRVAGAALNAKRRQDRCRAPQGSARRKMQRLHGATTRQVLTGVGTGATGGSSGR